MTIYDDVRTLLADNTNVYENEALFVMQVDGILEDVIDYTNNNFTKDGEVVYPYAVKKYVADLLEYQNRPEVKANLKSRSMGTVSYTYKDGAPSDLLAGLARYRRAKFHVYRPLR